MISAAELAKEIADAITAKMTALYPQSASHLTEYHAALAQAVAEVVIGYAVTGWKKPPEVHP
jgi:hypothetical protein